MALFPSLHGWLFFGCFSAVFRLFSGCFFSSAVFIPTTHERHVSDAANVCDSGKVPLEARPKGLLSIRLRRRWRALSRAEAVVRWSKLSISIGYFSCFQGVASAAGRGDRNKRGLKVLVKNKQSR